VRKIEFNIGNYESYYVDYIEGNLPSHLVLPFEQFLEENTDLIEGDLDTVLSPISIELSAELKKNLKVFDPSSTINLQNIECFLIAEKEELLPLGKRSELSNFLSAYPKFKDERNLIDRSSLAPNPFEVYLNKSQLKRKVFVLWPYWTSVAVAASIIGFFFFTPIDGVHSNSKMLAEFGEIHQKSATPIIDKNQTNSTQKPTENLIAANDHFTGKKTQAKQTKSTKNNSIGSLKTNAPVLIAFESPTFEVKKSATNATSYDHSAFIKTKGNNFALSMSNPAKPITNKLSDLIKQPIEFAKGKNDEEGRRGFFLKIGKLEIYSNREEKEKREVF
jgi:hypothetical protein